MRPPVLGRVEFAHCALALLLGRLVSEQRFAVWRYIGEAGTATAAPAGCRGGHRRSVSLMVMSNRGLVDRGMAYLASGLGPFVGERMAAAIPGGQDWVTMLAARDPSRYDTRRRPSSSDPRFLLRVVTEEWRVFKDQLSRVEQGFATELRDAGNRWAHGDPFSADDTYRTLDTMERLLTPLAPSSRPGRSEACGWACSRLPRRHRRSPTPRWHSQIRDGNNDRHR